MKKMKVIKHMISVNGGLTFKCLRTIEYTKEIEEQLKNELIIEKLEIIEIEDKIKIENTENNQLKFILVQSLVLNKSREHGRMRAHTCK